MKIVNKVKEFESVSEKVKVFKLLEKDGNIGITFDEMNADDVIRKL